MKLSEEQIQELYNFCRRRLIEHYDLQTELVDHLANGIEAQWEEHPERTFKDARLREFRKFGARGFEKVVRKRRQVMERRYFKIILRFYKDYFRLPRILLTLSTIFLITCVFIAIPIYFRYDVFLGILFANVVAIFYLYFKNRANNELEMVKNGKKWVLKDQIYSYGNLVNILNLFPITLNWSYFRNNIAVENIFILMGFATLITGMIILSYITVYVIPQKAEELLAKTYPEYKMVN